MTPEQCDKAEKYMKRSMHALAEADAILRAGLSMGAVNRAYYACFYAAHGLLITKGLEPKTHTAVRELLSREFVRDGQLDRSDARQFVDTVNALTRKRLEDL